MSVPLSPQARVERRGLLLAFGAFGSFWGAWSATLPAVRAQADISDGQLGLALGAIALAALPSMPLAGRLMDRHGPRRLLPLALLAFALSTLLPAFAGSLLPLVLALLVLGATTGVLDVAVNTATALWERLERRRLMAGAHGCFSLGVLVASVSAGFARDRGAGPVAILAVTLLVGLVVALTQPRYRAVAPGATAAGRGMRLAPVLLVLGLFIAGAFLVEDAVQSWSALHLERSLDAPPWVGGLGPGLFAASMAVGRFGVQWLARPGTDALVVGCGAAVLSGGTLLLALAPSPGVALIGATLAGADLAAVTALGYAGFVAGPPLLGLVSAATTLPTALALLAGLPLLIALVAPLVLRQTARSSTGTSSQA